MDHTPQSCGSWGSPSQHGDGGHRGHDCVTAGQPRSARVWQHCWLCPDISHPLGSSGQGHASACQGHAVIRWAQGLSRQDCLAQCHCKDPQGPFVSLLPVPVGCTCGFPPQCPSGMVHGHPPYPGHSDDGDSWPALSQARLPLWLGPCIHFMLLPCRSGLSRALPTSGPALGKTTPSWGPSRMGTPPGQLPVPVLTHCGGCWGHFLWSRSPQGHASRLHIWRPAVVLPHLPWAPAPGAVDAPAGPLLAPSLIPGDGMGKGLPGLQMVPLSRLLAPAPGDSGCPAWLGVGGCLAGAFPSSDRWSRIRAVAPPGWRLDLDSANILGWAGRDPVRHRGCVTGDVPLPCPE